MNPNAFRDCTDATCDESWCSVCCAYPATTPKVGDTDPVDLRAALCEYIAWVPDNRPIEKVRTDLLTLVEPNDQPTGTIRTGDATAILAELREAIRRVGTDNHGFISTREAGDLIRNAEQRLGEEGNRTWPASSPSPKERSRVLPASASDATPRVSCPFGSRNRRRGVLSLGGPRVS
jgi:hypothetical protein